MAVERAQPTSPTEDFALDDNAGPQSSEDHEGYEPTEPAARDLSDRGESVTEYTLTRDEQ